MSHNTEPTNASPGRIQVFRILAALTGALFVIAGLTNARAGWMLVTGATDDLHPELNRWFTTVAGASDLIMAGCFLALAWRPRRPILFFNNVVAFVVAAVLNLPFVPSFAFVLVLVVPALATYPYWSDLRGVTTWWRRPHKVMLVVSVLAAAVVFVIAGIAESRQVTANDAAAAASWWADYAEHISLVAIAGLIASSAQPGWRVIGGLAAGVWIYLGFVAAVILPNHNGSWGTVGGVAAMAIGGEFAITCLRGQSTEETIESRGPGLAQG